MRFGVRVLPTVLGPLLLAAVACGSTDAAPPTCASVWDQTKILPKDYDGCQDGTKFRNDRGEPCREAKGKRLAWFESPEGIYSAIPGDRIAFHPNDDDPDNIESFYLGC